MPASQLSSRGMRHHVVVAHSEEGEDLDEYLDHVLIGGSEARAIQIVDYDDFWPLRFEAERQQIQTALGSTARRIEHIGSTALRGLAAKPIIDVMVSVEDPDNESAYVPKLQGAGYVLVREPGHRMLRSLARDVQVHVWAVGSGDERRHLVFRDRLRRNEGDRREYEQTKRMLAGHWREMNHYARAKGEVIERIMRRAEASVADEQASS